LAFLFGKRKPPTIKQIELSGNRLRIGAEE
jgi:hypothetical protein